MRSFFVRAVVLAASVVALAGAFVMPAAADPPPSTTCGINSANADALDNALADGYNSGNPPALWCAWDATNPTTGAVHDTITLKPGCTLTRPNGSSEGIMALQNSSCVDFARSTRGPRASDTDPVTGLPLLFVRYLQDTLRYALSGATPSHGSLNLSAAQLAQIYTTSGITWNQVDPNNPYTTVIHALIPQAGSGYRAWFLNSIGVTEAQLRPDVVVIPENDCASIENDPDAIMPMSLAASRTRPACRVQLSDPVAGYSSVRFAYHVVRDAGGVTVPAYLQPILGNGTAGSGFICGNPNVIIQYGFDTIPACGVIEHI